MEFKLTGPIEMLLPIRSSGGGGADVLSLTEDTTLTEEQARAVLAGHIAIRANSFRCFMPAIELTGARGLSVFGDGSDGEVRASKEGLMRGGGGSPAGNVDWLKT